MSDVLIYLAIGTIVSLIFAWAIKRLGLDREFSQPGPLRTVMFAHFILLWPVCAATLAWTLLTAKISVSVTTNEAAND